MPELIARALRRSTVEPSLFANFYREHADSLVGYFMSRTGDAEVSLDLTAEVMARSFLKRSSFRGETDAAAAAWLYAIAARQLSSFRRKKRVEQKALRRLGLERTDPIPDAELQLVERETLTELVELLGDGLDDLTTTHREIVELRYFQGMSYAGIAAELGIAEGAARARLMRAIERLRGALRSNPEGIR